MQQAYDTLTPEREKVIRLDTTVSRHFKCKLDHAGKCPIVLVFNKSQLSVLWLTISLDAYFHSRYLNTLFPAYDRRWIFNITIRKIMCDSNLKNILLHTISISSSTVQSYAAKFRSTQMFGRKPTREAIQKMQFVALKHDSMLIYAFFYTTFCKQP